MFPHPEIEGMDNDTRGWVMSIVSGIACVVGASIICVDILIRYIPSRKDFKIQDSEVFLAASLSLSFGVMLFSSLYNILPSSKNYLKKGGFGSSTAAWILLACFIAGFIGIQIISRFLHHYMPSHVVDCDHNHGESSTADNSREHSRMSRDHSRRHSHGAKTHDDRNGKVTEVTPLIGDETGHSSGPHLRSHQHASLRSDVPLLPDSRRSSQVERRPSMVQVQSRVMSFVRDRKNNCDEGGPCFGYSDPCGRECFKHVTVKSSLATKSPTLLRASTVTIPHRHTLGVQAVLEEGIEAEAVSTAAVTSKRASGASSRISEDIACDTDEEDLEAQHHHHVPENSFMSIGLQTSIAIALHKLPEGFITYATNHANPSLGLSVFMALFIHNITEGFAMALPLYLALGSRVRAMFWSSLLGGVSQPLGAGIAAMWFKLAGGEEHAPGFVVYGCMFGVTAGIMTSVALQLFVESLSLNHNRNLCIAFAFVGMAILGMSNALTAE